VTGISLHHLETVEPEFKKLENVENDPD